MNTKKPVETGDNSKYLYSYLLIARFRARAAYIPIFIA